MIWADKRGHTIVADRWLCICFLKLRVARTVPSDTEASQMRPPGRAAYRSPSSSVMSVTFQPKQAPKGPSLQGSREERGGPSNHTSGHKDAGTGGLRALHRPRFGADLERFVAVSEQKVHTCVSGGQHLFHSIVLLMQKKGI